MYICYKQNAKYIKMNLFYAPDLSPDSKNYTFDKNESRHIVKSLRKKNDEILYLTNGKGDWFEAIITTADPKHTQINILSVTKKDRRPYRIHIAMAPTKSNDRYEWFLEKAVEIGIDEITPILTRYSERKKINLTRYDKIVVSAMKQSLQAYKPKLNDLMPFDKLIEQNVENTQKFMAFCQADNALFGSIIPQQDILILIGPEGGFSDIEIQKARDNAFKTVRISPNRLRTETAGLVSLMTAHLQMNNLQPNKK